MNKTELRLMQAEDLLFVCMQVLNAMRLHHVNINKYSILNTYDLAKQIDDFLAEE